MIKIQKRHITGYAYKMAKKMMPKISDTERAALNAGTVGFDRNIFNGNPTLEDLKNYSVKASPEEQGETLHTHSFTPRHLISLFFPHSFP